MQLKAEDIVNNNPVTLEPNKTLYDVRNILIKYNISRVVIVEKEKEENKEVIGSRNIITAKKDTDISTCAKLLLDNNISSLIITVNRLNDGSNILGGIITKSDLLDAYVKSYGGNVAVNEYMTKRMLTVRPDEPVHM